ncbi:MAG TPA: ATP-binding protein [Longimicrobiales bacterium]|nr:ATP-binding protein [Longimicrobiales bacterium]
MSLELTSASATVPPAPPAPEPAPAVQAEHAILQAVVRAATEFLRSTDLKESLHTLLADIGAATQASRAYAFENDLPLAGAFTTATLYAEWTAPGIDPQQGMPGGKHIGLDGAASDRWFRSFSNGEPFAAVVSDLPNGVRAQMEALHILSIAVVPVFSEGRFWGFVGVDNCVSARPWTAIEVEALAAAAVVVGAAISRSRMEEHLRDATVKAQLAADIGEVVTRAGDTVQQMLERCSEAIVRRLQPDLVRIWMMSEDLECLHACQSAGTATIQSNHSADVPLVSAELARVARDGGVITWRDGLPDLWPGCEVVYRQHDLRAGVGLRLVTNGRVTGIVVLLGRAFPSAAVIDALESVTDEIALAIERHHAQSARTRAELRYRRLVDATIEGIVIHDGSSVVDANPSFAAMVGYSLEEIIGLSPFGFIAPEWHDTVRGNLVSNYQHPYEVEGVHRDGRRFPVELKGSDFFDDGRKLRVAAVRDITDRKAAQNAAERLHEEQAARELAERTRERAQFLAEASRILASSLDTSTTLKQLAVLAIPELADYCVISTVQNGVIERVAVVHSDPQREQVLRESVSMWPEAFPPDHPIFAALVNNRHYMIEEVTEEAIAAIAVNPEHLQYLRLMGARSLMAVPISLGGTLMGAMILSLTRPDRRYGAEDLALAEEFAHRAALALQSARSYHLAQSASQARDEMLAVVAHDLRNPLNTIIMGSELALEMADAEAVDAPGTRQLQIVLRSAEHMQRLIQDLLDASRLDSGSLALEKVTLRPADLLREASEMLAPLAAHASIDFRIESAPDLPVVCADRGRLLQVLSNLVGNGIKFTPKGGTVRVSAMAGGDAASATRDVTFSVRDTGSGIPADQLPHVFARGWQARRGDRRGIGLGLAIASGIVEAHGGRIWAESVVGEGSCFTFTVPAA